MTGQTTRYDVRVGDVRDSQIVIGDHNTIVTRDGVEVVKVISAEERPVPRLRPMPIHARPPVGRAVFGRERDLVLLGAAAAERPIEVYGPEGIGKTALLKLLAAGAALPLEGVLYARARRRSLDDLLAVLFDAFWECDVRFVPGPGQMTRYLADRRALIVVDDLDPERSDLDELLDSVPGCTVVVGSLERTLWGRGTARQLPGLGAAAGVELLERELGRTLEGPERGAAETVVARLDGHPQRLVETAALVSDGAASLEELASRDPPGVAPRPEPRPTESERRLLEVLGAVRGAAVGASHVGRVAGVQDAPRQLAELERRGWVKSQSPRYRLVRPLPDADVVDRTPELLDELARWGERASPEEVAEEAEAVEAALERGARDGLAPAALALARATESKLALAGQLDSWARVLHSGLDAARAAGSPADEAHMLHELGSRAICVGPVDEAVVNLEGAIRIRDRLGDRDGADLSRRNLGQLGGGGPGDGGDGDDRGGGRGPWRARLAVVLGALVAGVAAAVVLASGDDSKRAEPSTPSRARAIARPAKPTPGRAPAIRIVQPVDGARYPQGATVPASFACAAGRRAVLTSCRGSVSVGAPIDTSAGEHTFVVVASDDRGKSARLAVRYTVTASATRKAPPISGPTSSANARPGTPPTPLPATPSPPTSAPTTTSPAPPTTSVPCALTRSCPPSTLR